MVELPASDGPWQQFEEPREHFTQTLQGIGGQVIPVPDIQAVHAVLVEQQLWMPEYAICSLVDGVEPTTVDLATIADPHDLANVDLAILRGEFGVAENGAIWLTDTHLKHRALPFITQHLALILSAKAIVHTMHEAYRQIAFTQAGFGVFISGPSKTADIEQSLVLGAHGARSLTVFLIENEVDAAHRNATNTPHEA